MTKKNEAHIKFTKRGIIDYKSNLNGKQSLRLITEGFDGILGALAQANYIQKDDLTRYVISYLEGELND
ncbi:hypothetical protein ACVPPR_07355 [Dellaglioa sp. L3N]